MFAGECLLIRQRAKQRIDRAQPRRSAAPAAILLVAAMLIASAPGVSAQVELVPITETLVQLRGPGWQIEYGTNPHFDKWVKNESAAQAWFAHGLWLRRIDTKKGVVTGRWQFPGKVLEIASAGSGGYEVTVLVEEGFTNEAGESKRPMKIAFDPPRSAIPFWPTGNLLLLRMTLTEMDSGFGFRVQGIRGEKVTAGQSREAGEKTPEFINKLDATTARQFLPHFEELARRDSFTPFIQAALAKLLRDAGDPRADAAFRQAIEIPGAEYVELFQLAFYLERFGEREAARAAFDRAYHLFWERGNDPRLLTFLIDRLIYFVTPHWPPEQQPPGEVRREILERIYLVAPHAEGAELAWKLYSEQLEREGDTAAARNWRARAEDARQNSLLLMDLDFVGRLDQFVWILPGGVLAGVIFVVVLYLRYRPQRRFDQAARRRAPLLNLAYWSRRERLGFAAIALAAWLGTGFATCWAVVLLHYASLPTGLANGSFAGPAGEHVFQHRLPATPERDLLLAISRHQSGENAQAEALYRRLPQFAESWNNLGVLLKNAGREDEARQAFERALEIDPALAEAALNLGRPQVAGESAAGASFWAQVYATNQPGRPMLAPPRRPQLMRAFAGGGLYRTALRALAGPFAAGGLRVGQLLGESVGLGRLYQVGCLLLAALALGLLFAVPTQPVTQPPGRWQSVREALFPGTSPSWGVFGGVVLLGWTYSIIQLLLVWIYGTPRIFLSISAPNLVRSYGIPWEVSTGRLLQDLGPGWPWLIVPPLLIFAVNLALVLRARNRERSVSAEA